MKQVNDVTADFHTRKGFIRREDTEKPIELCFLENICMPDILLSVFMCYLSSCDLRNVSSARYTSFLSIPGIAYISYFFELNH